MVKTEDYQCMRLLKRLFKTSGRLTKVHLKYNSALNHDLNAEPTFCD